MICIAYGELKQKIDTSSKWQGSRWPCRSYVLPESWEIVKFWSRALSCDQQWPADFTHNRSWVVFFYYVHLCLFVSIIFYLFLSIYLYLLVSVSLSLFLSISTYMGREKCKGSRHHYITNLLIQRWHPKSTETLSDLWTLIQG